MRKLGAREWEEIIIKVMASPKRRRTSTPLVLWDREEILCCHCPEMSSRHTHCPCDLCCGKAVARSTELRHWTVINDLIMRDTGGVGQDVALLRCKVI